MAIAIYSYCMEGRCGMQPLCADTEEIDSKKAISDYDFPGLKNKISLSSWSGRHIAEENTGRFLIYNGWGQTSASSQCRSNALWYNNTCNEKRPIKDRDEKSRPK